MLAQYGFEHEDRFYVVASTNIFSKDILFYLIKTKPDSGKKGEIIHQERLDYIDPCYVYHNQHLYIINANTGLGKG